MQPLVTSVTGPQTDSDQGKHFPDSDAIMTRPRQCDQEQHPVILVSRQSPRKILGVSPPGRGFPVQVLNSRALSERGQHTSRRNPMQPLPDRKT